MKQNRYIRQTSLKDFGPERQEMLQKARVLVIGAGGLGIPVLQYLSAMGVGVLGVVEQDVVELSNLQRQVLYGEKDVAKPKIEVVLKKLREMNSEILFHGHDTFLTPSNALEIVSDYDLVVDASDNFATRYLINDACVILGIPFVSGAIHGFEGQVSVFNYQDGPTYRCLFPTPPEPGSIKDCNANGVLGVIPGIIGSLQAMEVVKVLTEMPGILKGKLLIYHGIDQSLRQITFPAIPANKTRKALESIYETPDCARVPTVGVERLKKELTENPEGIMLLDVRTAEEYREDGLEEATHIPLEDLEKYGEKLPLQKTVYCICRSGSRSLTAARNLLDARGNLRVYSVEGGMEAWQKHFGIFGEAGSV
ncbi:adenylyltransferase and sulfurtransferase [Muriicola jejuensis]|uniref:Molybdopterin-synthase adenylyltransferase n=1 Tax=Muriicola jejuensis TaxID=504488 RepID=A0A6P0UFQ3_9FLAO|nr:HesA/MoeB/ThiF family protein [Muriicola jejuensis]NER11280.1 sulfurtransferase [Muriicola jejuensis]SMP21785.1 adenylyltransferase and sulfurtransferase [Muriicola jejuensis]